MRKILLILAAFFVLSATPSLAIYQEGEEQPTPADGEMTLMTATSDTTTPKARAMEAKDAMKSAISDARTAFKEKLAGIKDARKQKIMENLDARLAELNKKKTDMLMSRLDRLSSILTKVSEMEGAVDADVEAAAAAIATAKTAVEEQAAKEYVVDVTTETALKTNARAAIKEFITDMKAVVEKVRLAQVAVAKVAKGAKPTPTVTTAATQ